MGISILVITAYVAVYGFLHSFLASLFAKVKARTRFGAAADRYYRLFYNFIAIITLLPLPLLFIFLPDQSLYRIPYPILLFFFLVQVCGLIILLVAIRQTGAAALAGIAQISEKEKAASGVFVDSGLYRWVRHPIYSGGLLLFWFFPMMSVNILTLDICLTAYILIGMQFEERKLVAEFGSIYDAYRRVTPALIPFIKH